MITLAIIKPDAVGAGKAGKILAQLESAGFKIRAARLVKLTTAQAEAFYAVHRERPFYRSLVAFMTSGPALAVALDRKSTRLNSSHSQISYAVFCLKKKKKKNKPSIISGEIMSQTI